MREPQSVSVTQLLKRHGLWATKKLGQNFLQDAGKLQQIADAAEITRADTVLEIGPGLGSLTPYLCLRAQDVVAVELDGKLIPVLSEVLKPYGNVRVVEGDMLALSPAALGLPNGYLVAANIPYNITSAILRHLLASTPRPRRMVLTVQKEVAERICASSPDMSLLALSVQVYGEPSIVVQIPSSAFFPVPKVDSAILRVDILPAPRIDEALLSTFFQLSKAGFSQRRKTLRNSISAGMRISPAEAGELLSGAGIAPQRRAETLAISEWGALSRAWRERRQRHNDQ